MTEIYLIFILLDKMNSECRICRVNSKNLINPCNCTDPVCADCIQKWGADRTNCEVCKEPYSIAKLEPSMHEKVCWVIGRFIFACFNIGIDIVVILVVLFIMIGTSYPQPRGFWTASKENALGLLYILGSIPIIIWQLVLKNYCLMVYIQSFSTESKIPNIRKYLNINNLGKGLSICCGNFDENCDTARNNLIYPNSKKYKFKILGAFLFIFVTTIETCTGILVIYIVEHRVMFNIIAWYYGVITHIIIILGPSLLLGSAYLIAKIFIKIFKSLSNIYNSEHQTETTYVDKV